VSGVHRPSLTRVTASVVAGAALVCSLLIGADVPGQASPQAAAATGADLQLAAVVAGSAAPDPVSAVVLQPSEPPAPGASADLVVTADLEALFDSVASQAVSTDAKDTDGDGVPDSVERRLGTNPHKKDTDGDGIPDGKEDPDRDTLTTLFEIRKTHTDPGDPDSDNDGIRDGAEDPDGDKLSNRGEQKYKTNPRKKDTDGDGRNDWHEDFDHDGKPNGMEQDNFSLPSDLKPRLSQASSDIPVSSSHKCHQINGLSKPISCSFGHSSGKLVILMGDSHAVHWFPAIYAVAKERHWHLLTLTKSACPFADVPTIRYKQRDTACEAWRVKAFAKVKRLHPDLLIASSLDIYGFIGDGGNPTSSHSEAVWKAGLTRSLKKLHKTADKVVMLGDIVDFGGKSLSCLAAHKHDVAACEVRANGKAQIKREATARKAAAAAHVSYASTRKLGCPYDPCPLVVDRYLVTRDGGHLSATYSAVLWRGMLKLLPRI
jgi:SGNH domain (fused to AT3 domains)/Bacterial TSP3 repeat